MWLLQSTMDYIGPWAKKMTNTLQIQLGICTRQGRAGTPYMKIAVASVTGKRTWSLYAEMVLRNQKKIMPLTLFFLLTSFSCPVDYSLYTHIGVTRTKRRTLDFCFQALRSNRHLLYHTHTAGRRLYTLVHFCLETSSIYMCIAQLSTSCSLHPFSRVA